MKKIKLTQNKHALVDDEDYEFINKWKWHYNGGYAVRMCRKSKDSRSKVLMHRLLIECPDGRVVDHKDGDGLNNTRSNLRVCSQSQNCMNRRKSTQNRSGVKGVGYHKILGLWRARIKKNGVTTYLGNFATIHEASIAYQVASKTIHGDFSRM